MAAEAEAMDQPFVVLRTRGPAWDEARTLEQQADWIGHAAFMDDLLVRGIAVLVGRLGP